MFENVNYENFPPVIGRTYFCTKNFKCRGGGQGTFRKHESYRLEKIDDNGHLWFYKNCWSKHKMIHRVDYDLNFDLNFAKLVVSEFFELIHTFLVIFLIF